MEKVRLNDVTGGNKIGQGVVQLCDEQTYRHISLSTPSV